MAKRDEFVDALKAQIDRWNSDLARCEKEAAGARADLRKKYEEQIATAKAQREKALYQLKLLEGASAAAWSDLSRGAEEAAKRFREAVAEASEHFAKRP